MSCLSDHVPSIGYVEGWPIHVWTIFSPKIAFRQLYQSLYKNAYFVVISVVKCPKRPFLIQINIILKVVKLLLFCCVHCTSKMCNNFTEIDDSFTIVKFLPIVIVSSLFYEAPKTVSGINQTCLVSMR